MSGKFDYPILLSELDWFYGDKQVLNSVSLNIEKGKFYSIIGPNGSGKTTLLKNISKGLNPAKNSVFIEGIDASSLKYKELAKRVSSVPQSTSINFDFSTFDVVLMGRNPYIGRFMSESEHDLEITKNAMISTNTWQLKDKNINEISGGERQRVIIARALAQETDIMLLDEPVSQLDIHHQIELMDTLVSLKRNRNKTIVAVLHDLNLAAQFSDFLILLKDGAIVSMGEAKDVLTCENIEKTYNLEVVIMKNPINGKPHIFPVKINNWVD